MLIRVAIAIKNHSWDSLVCLSEVQSMWSTFYSEWKVDKSQSKGGRYPWTNRNFMALVWLVFSPVFGEQITLTFEQFLPCNGHTI